MFHKPISISFAPNYQRDDVLLALKLLLGVVTRDQKKQAPRALALQIEKLFPSQKAFLFSSGRAALAYTLRALGLAEGDEVLIQAFTCVAVPNAVLAAGLSPIFVDVDATYNLNLQDLAQKITPLTKAVVVQHTFGIPAPMEDVVAIARAHGIFVVEDCAHALGGEYKGKKLGTWGDVAILSFGRDKVVSSVFGGAVVSKDTSINKRLAHYEKNLAKAPLFFSIQQLSYLVLYALALPFYNILIGKILLRVVRIGGLLSPAVYDQEKKGKMPRFTDYAFPEALCMLALHQLAKLDCFLKHRKKISAFYIEKLKLPLERRPYLRVPYGVENKIGFLKKAQKAGLHLGNWYRGPVDPPDADLDRLGYVACPQAEKNAQHTVNLPTNINVSLHDAQKVVSFIQKNV